MKEREYPFSIKQIEDNSGFLLWQVSSIWEQKQKYALESIHKITHSQYVIMASIYWLTLSGEEVTQISLSQHTKIEPMTVSQLLKVLQKKEYIHRKPHSKDTRAKTVYLTDNGKVLMEKAIVTIEAIDADFFKVLGRKIGKFNQEMLKLIYQNSMIHKSI